MRRSILLILIMFFLGPVTSFAYRLNSIQISASGSGEGTIAFSGWCEIDIGNKELHKEKFAGKNKDMSPINLHGSYIDRCELVNEAGSGSVTLSLTVNDREIFRKTSKKHESSIVYGPTMKRFSNTPYPFNRLQQQENSGQNHE